MDVSVLLSCLGKVKRLKSRKHAYSFSALCPSHNDRNPSLCVDVANDGRILIFCRAGCGAVEVINAVGLSMSDLFPSSDYRRPPGYTKDQIDHSLTVANICQSDLGKGIVPRVSDLVCIDRALKILNYTRRLIREGGGVETN